MTKTKTMTKTNTKTKTKTMTETNTFREYLQRAITRILCFGLFIFK